MLSQSHSCIFISLFLNLENSNAEMMAALATMNPEACAKTFAEIALGLQRYPPQITPTLANQIGAMWTPWAVGLKGATTASSSPNSGFSFPSSHSHHQQHQQPKDRPSYPALTNSIDVCIREYTTTTDLNLHSRLNLI